MDLNSLPDRFKSKVDLTEDCWLWTATKKGFGYGGYWLNGKNIPAHRFSWQHFHGEIPEGLKVLHKCDVPSCVNPSHLFLGTSKENSLDMKDKNRQAKGENHGYSKLTREQVEEIRNIYRRGKGKDGKPSEFSSIGLSKRFGVGSKTILNIINKINWVG